MTSIVINGTLSYFFNVMKGVYQGDLLSPFVLIIIEKYLSQGISYKCEIRLWIGILILGIPSNKCYWL